MKEFYTRREVMKKAAKCVATGFVGLGSGEALSLVDNPSSTGKANSSEERILYGAKDVVSAVLIVGGVGLIGGGLSAGGMALADNLPIDDKGNQREFVGYGESKHFMVSPTPIYTDKKSELEE